MSDHMYCAIGSMVSFIKNKPCCVQKLLKTNTSNTYLLLACYGRYVSIVCFTVIVKFPSLSDNWKSMLEKVLHFCPINAESVIPWLKALYIIYIVGDKYQAWYFMAIIFLKLKFSKIWQNPVLWECSLEFILFNPFVL